jgi:hypothetical protein
MCDICGIERKIFEKKGMDFEFHKLVEHNLWDYVFYLVYLHTLDSQSLTGFEHFVFSKFKQKSTAWLPIGSTSFLKGIESTDENINILQKQMKEFNAALEERMDKKFALIMDTLVDLKSLVKKSPKRNQYLDDDPKEQPGAFILTTADDKAGDETERTSSRRKHN